MDKETTLKEYFGTDGGGVGKIEILLDFERIFAHDTTYNKLVEECDSFLKELIEKYNG